jgi:hypothetical protein
MIWFLERDADVMICEIRRAIDGRNYEFEVISSQGPPATLRFSSATELLNGYLSAQSALRAKGWRPHLGDIVV